MTRTLIIDDVKYTRSMVQLGAGAVAYIGKPAR